MVTLATDGVKVVLSGIRPCRPFLDIGDHCFPVTGHLDPAQDDIADLPGPPGPGIEHVEGEPLALHAEIEELQVVNPDPAFPEVRRCQAIGSLQAQIVGQEGKVMLIAGAEDDRTHIGLRHAPLDIIQRHRAGRMQSAFRRVPRKNSLHPFLPPD